GRRRGPGLLRWHALLVAQNIRTNVSRGMGTSRGCDRVYRLQPDVLPAVHPRIHGNAATVLGLLAYARMASAERAFDRGRQHSGCRVPAAYGVHAVVAALRQG